MKILLAYEYMDPSRGGPFFSIIQINKELKKKKIKSDIIDLKNSSFFDILFKIYSSDLIHLFGGWNFFYILIFMISKLLKKKIINHTLGLYEPWSLSQKKWKKKIALFFYQKKILKSCDLIHCASVQEKNNLLKICKNLKIIVLPFGVDISFFLQKKQLQKKVFGSRAIFASRIHPKKGVDELIHAWIKADNPKWKLDIMGPADDLNFLSKIKKLCNRRSDINILQPVFDSRSKKKIWSQYDLMILPTHNENFGIVIIEFLSLGVPVFISDQTPWTDIQKYKAGWIFKKNKKKLYKNLKKILNHKQFVLKKRSFNALDFSKKFSWEFLIKSYVSTYKKIINF